jgi:hypothetical protein
LFLFAPRGYRATHARVIFGRHRPHHVRQRNLRVAIERIADARARVAN